MLYQCANGHRAAVASIGIFAESFVECGIYRVVYASELLFADLAAPVGGKYAVYFLFDVAKLRIAISCYLLYSIKALYAH